MRITGKKFDNLDLFLNRMSSLFDLSYIYGNFKLKFDDIPTAVEAYFAAGDSSSFDPSPYFSRRLYQELHQDVRWSSQDPLEHYLKIGRFEGRTPHPLFHVRLVQEQNPQIASDEIYFAFLRGETAGHFHELVNPRYVTAQAAEVSGALRVFAEFADARTPLRLSPHPLFDTELYRGFRRAPIVPNELIDFLLHPRDCLITSPFFDPAFYMQTAGPGQLEIPPLLHYLRSWHLWRGDISLFVDVKFLNHQIGAAIERGEKDNIGEPLSFALMHHIRTSKPLIHPQTDPGAVARAFANLLINDPANKVPEAAQAAAVFKHFLRAQPRSASP